MYVPALHVLSFDFNIEISWVSGCVIAVELSSSANVSTTETKVQKRQSPCVTRLLDAFFNLKTVVNLLLYYSPFETCTCTGMYTLI